MRFLPAEHKAFKEIIESSKYEYSTFSFVKKKGWLCISHSRAIEPFRFHRKEETLLDDNGKWTDARTYHFGIEVALMESTEFDAVCSAFSSWLK